MTIGKHEGRHLVQTMPLFKLSTQNLHLQNFINGAFKAMWFIHK